MDADTERAVNFITEPGFGRHAFNHFMEAMKAGYASTPVKGTIAELPGSKTIEYRHEKWRVLDTYFVTPQNGYSGGSIVMWYGPVPVLMMQYSGYYEECAIPCLKAALKKSFDAGKFRGGRGPEFFVHDGYSYTNIMEENNFLGNTRGKEHIFDINGKSVGWHRYHSMYMAK